MLDFHPPAGGFLGHADDAVAHFVEKPWASHRDDAEADNGQQEHQDAARRDEHKPLWASHLSAIILKLASIGRV